MKGLAVQSGSGNIKFSSGVQTSRSFGPAPKIVNYRESPTPHAKAAKAPKAKATSDQIYPRRPNDVATSGNPV